MTQPYQLYQVAIVPPEPARGEIRALIERFAAEVGGTKILQAPPHITLSPPFLCNDPDALAAALADALGADAAFELELPHLDHFRHHETLYYAVAPNDALQRVHEHAIEVVAAFRKPDYKSYYRAARGRGGELLQRYGSEFVLERFLPHLSLTRHDADREKYRALVESEPDAPPVHFTVGHVAVLVQEPDGWKVLREIPLA